MMTLAETTTRTGGIRYLRKKEIPVTKCINNQLKCKEPISLTSSFTKNEKVQVSINGMKAFLWVGHASTCASTAETQLLPELFCVLGEDLLSSGQSTQPLLQAILASIRS